MFDKLWKLLDALDGVQQNRAFHPEGDALFHSLQVFEHARAEVDDWELLAAALLHDVGKALDSRHHAALGAAMLEGLVPPRVVWLVEHHLDLLKAPAATKQALYGSPLLADLRCLRRWDLAGRAADAWVPDLDDALGYLMNAMAHSQLQLDESATYEEPV